MLFDVDVSALACIVAATAFTCFVINKYIFSSPTEAERLKRVKLEKELAEVVFS